MLPVRLFFRSFVRSFVPVSFHSFVCFFVRLVQDGWWDSPWRIEYLLHVCCICFAFVHVVCIGQGEIGRISSSSLGMRPSFKVPVFCVFPWILMHAKTLWHGLGDLTVLY